MKSFPGFSLSQSPSPVLGYSRHSSSAKPTYRQALVMSALLPLSGHFPDSCSPTKKFRRALDPKEARQVTSHFREETRMKNSIVAVLTAAAIWAGTWPAISAEDS